MDLGLSGKRILVTGGSKGIGRVICKKFLTEGAFVEMCARNAEQVAATETDLSDVGPIKGSAVDVSDKKALTEWVNAAAKRMGGIDYVVSNASAFGIGTGEDQWKAGFEVDIMGTQFLIDAALPHLQHAAAENGDASVVTISSTAALEASFGNAYGAVKASVIQLSKGLARQYASAPIRFNCVSPGTVYFEGGTWHNFEQNAHDIYKQAVERNPTGRMGTPSEIANAVLFLASPRSSFTTGSNLVVDGAITARVNY